MVLPDFSYLGGGGVNQTKKQSRFETIEEELEATLSGLFERSEEEDLGPVMARIFRLSRRSRQDAGGGGFGREAVPLTKMLIQLLSNQKVRVVLFSHEYRIWI